MKKRDKIELYTELSTFSTLNEVESVDYFLHKKEQAFCEQVIKIVFCRNNFKLNLTFKMSKYVEKCIYNSYQKVMLLKSEKIRYIKKGNYER